MPSDENRELLQVALKWLDRGFSLLPVQPNTKRLVKGFGPRVRQISTVQEVTEWFYDRRINIAVVAPMGITTLDFDDPKLYKSWVGRYPHLKTTLTGKTPGGGVHAWFYCDMPSGVNWVPGVELKLSVLVYPSMVDGKKYTIERGGILHVHDLGIFSPLSAPGFRSPYVLNIIHTREIYQSPELIGSTIERIKKHLSIVDMLQEVDPNFLHSLKNSNQRYLVGNCPFQQDKDSHFWVDTELNLFGCHKCKVRGDVINLFAMLKDIPLKSAIGKLRERVDHG